MFLGSSYIKSHQAQESRQGWDPPLETTSEFPVLRDSWRRRLLFPAFKLWTNLLCSGRQLIQPALPREIQATEKPSLQRSETENRNWKAQVLISGALRRLVPLICCVFNNPGFNLNESDAPSPKIFYSSLWVTLPAQPPTHPSLTSLLWFGYGWSRQRSPWFLMSQCCWIVMRGLLRQICDLLSKLDGFLGELIHSGELWPFRSRRCLIFNIALLLTSSAFSFALLTCTEPWEPLIRSHRGTRVIVSEFQDHSQNKPLKVGLSQRQALA